MLKHGKTAQTAIIAVSCLAAVYDVGSTRLSSRDIAQSRQLPQPIVAKLLVTLSQAGLVDGTPGPKGGYRLARKPSAISLLDVVSIFENLSERISQPIDTATCNCAVPCPLHGKLRDIGQQLVDFLAESTFDAFPHSTQLSRIEP